MNIGYLEFRGWQAPALCLVEITDKEPSSLVWFGGFALCLAAASLMAKFRPATFLAVPLMAGFVAFCAFYLFHELSDPDVGRAIILELGYRHIALVCAYGLITAALGISLLLRGFGMRRSLWIGTFFIVIAVPVLALGGSNAADYLRIRRVFKRATGLSRAQLVALAARCAAVKGYHHYENEAIPPEFAPLQPQRVEMVPGLAYASLYELGDVFLEFRIKTSESHQQIYFFSNTEGVRKATRVWEQPPEPAQHDPSADRILTVSAYGLHSYRHWIVLPDRLLVVDRATTAGAKDPSKSIPLDAASAAEIRRLAQDLKQRRGGHVYDNVSVEDGVSLRVSFSASGEADGNNDVSLSNVWLDDLAPLLDAIAKVAPDDSPNKVRQNLIETQATVPTSMRVRTIEETFEEHPRLPLSGIWRKWVTLRLPPPSSLNSDISDPLKYIGH